MAPLNKPYYDTNTALFTSPTSPCICSLLAIELSMGIMLGECMHKAWVIN